MNQCPLFPFPVRTDDLCPFIPSVSTQSSMSTVRKSHTVRYFLFFVRNGYHRPLTWVRNSNTVLNLSVNLSVSHVSSVNHFPSVTRPLVNYRLFNLASVFSSVSEPSSVIFFPVCCICTLKNPSSVKFSSVRSICP